jgi:hypothetical protein
MRGPPHSRRPEGHWSVATATVARTPNQTLTLDNSSHRPQSARDCAASSLRRGATCHCPRCRQSRSSTSGTSIDLASDLTPRAPARQLPCRRTWPGAREIVPVAIGFTIRALASGRLPWRRRDRKGGATSGTRLPLQVRHTRSVSTRTRWNDDSRRLGVKRLTHPSRRLAKPAMAHAAPTSKDPGFPGLSRPAVAATVTP